MCGFVALFTAPGRQIGADVLEAMTGRLSHRGPDGTGCASIEPMTGRAREWKSQPPEVTVGGVLFGHRRLKILDLSDRGHQPMFNDDGSLALVYNGEVFNYVELRHELEGSGARFRSRTDTEVVLRAYERWGNDAFQRFIGMWAVAIWDQRKHRLVVSRDRFGVKPLFHTQVDGTWIFASEIKALLAFPGAFRGLVSDNIRAMVEDGQIDVSEETIYRDIYTFPPGIYAELAQGRMERTRFWRLTLDDRFSATPESEIVDRYAELLQDSVRLRTRSDVPVGTMLSGGLDSTSVTALVHESRARVKPRLDETRTQEQVSFQHTITACWPGWEYDEEIAAEKLSSKYGLSNHKVYLTAEPMADALAEVASCLDQPFTQPTALVQYLLMRRASELGVTVVLNGHGSDEVLAGYPWTFVAPFLANLLVDGSWVTFVRSFVAFRSMRRSWSSRQIPESCRWYWNQRSAWRRRELEGRVETPQRLDPRTPWDRRADGLQVGRAPSALTMLAWRFFSSDILPRWLRMEDHVSMAWSVESRLPFMDHRLVEFSFNLPDRLKLRDGYTKYILRMAMKDRLPASITFLRKKTPFSAPFHPWIKGEWRGVVQESLLGKSRLEEHMDVTDLQARVRRALEGETERDSFSLIWRALSTEFCLRAVANRCSGPGAGSAI